MFDWLKNKIASSPNIVVTGDGVLNILDIEARFRSDRGHHGKLKQSRWSDGQERFSLRLRDLGSDHGGKLYLSRNGMQVSEFEIEGRHLTFEWKGMSSDAIPGFDVGDQLELRAGSVVLHAIVEPD